MRWYLVICLLGGGVALLGCQREASDEPVGATGEAAQDATERTGDVVEPRREEVTRDEPAGEGARAAAPIRVRSLSIGERSVAEASEVLYSPFADAGGERAVIVGMALEAGDLLSSRSSEVVVGLDCGGSVAVLSGGFRVLINTTEGEDCVLDLLSGVLDVLADAPTEVNVGGVVLGTEGTAYSVWPTRRDDEPRTYVCVYDGSVSVRGARELPAIDRIGGGTGVVLGEQEAATLPQREFERQSEQSAQAYARQALARYALEDVRDAPATGAYDQLHALYQAVLRDADAPEPRVELAKALLRYDEVGKAAYQLRRAGVIDEESLERYRIDPWVLRRGLTDRDREGVRQH